MNFVRWKINVKKKEKCRNVNIAVSFDTIFPRFNFVIFYYSNSFKVFYHLSAEQENSKFENVLQCFFFSKNEEIIVDRSGNFLWVSRQGLNNIVFVAICFRSYPK